MSHAEKRMKEIGRGKKAVFRRPKRTRVLKPQGPRGRQKWPRAAWAYSNFGNLLGIARTQTAAIIACQEHADTTWTECRAYMEVWKCEVSPTSHSQFNTGEAK